jgi:ribonuclease P protein component
LLPKLETLKRRAEFLAANSGARAARAGFVLLGRRRKDEEKPAGDLIRFGLTVTKRTGGAVERNRIRRRLRALARDHLPVWGRAGWDYVLIGRKPALSRPYAALERDLESALEMLHKAGRARPGSPASRKDRSKGPQGRP